MGGILLRAAAAAHLIMSGAQAADGFKTHYAAYARAAEAGDNEAMLTHAERAWRAARQELGASETTALLAQNRLYLTLWSDPEDTRDAAAAALELGRAGYGLGNMSLSELVIADAYARLAPTPSHAGAEEVMRAILADRETGRELLPFSALAYRHGIDLAFAAEAPGAAYVLASALAKETEPLEAERALFAEATLKRGVARLLENQSLRLDRAAGRIEASKPYQRQIADAYVLFEQAASAFPPAMTLNEIEPVAAQAKAWSALVRALGASLRIRRMEEHVFEGHTAERADISLLSGRGSGCDANDVVWRNQALSVPRGFGDNALGAAAVFGYTLNADGTVDAPRLVAEVPGEVMNERTLRQIGKWRADPEKTPPGCFGERTLTYRIHTIQR